MATGLAILVGQVIPTRWYWAAIVAFVVIVGTRSRGDSFIKASQYLAGTVGGVAWKLYSLGITLWFELIASSQLRF